MAYIEPYSAKNFMGQALDQIIAAINQSNVEITTLRTELALMRSKLEKMRMPMAMGWQEGYETGKADVGKETDNPYVKEEDG